MTLKTTVTKPYSHQVSVIIPAYNASALIKPTLESVVNSTLTDFEVIVIDDGSSDNTFEVASNIDPRIQVIRQKNAGMSASRNKGIELSKGEFIALLDADDIWHPQKLEFQVNALNSNSQFDFCFTEFTSWHGENNQDFSVSKRSASIEPSLTGWIYHKMLLTNWALPSSVMFRKTAWDKLGSFICEDHQTDDWEYFVRASKTCQFVKLKESFVLYRQISSSLSRRVPEKNATEIMRSTLIKRFGYTSPDGAEVDHKELSRRSYNGHSHFADAHVARGKLSIGLKAFFQLLIKGPNRTKTMLTLLKSIFKRIKPV
ncbi:glycosyltransferase family 2 protein [Aliiglaciecola sp. SL4]|uniref:glycosyltransferase family 2 protein n=1 Tax=Aliiglaciecola sp. SL4 TaxID=3239806 RepID=UPI00355B5E49